VSYPRGREMKRLRRGQAVTDIVMEYLTPLNMLLFLTLFMLIIVIAWYINVWWTIEQERLKLIQAATVTP
jgi:hypothetical protein